MIKQNLQIIKPILPHSPLKKTIFSMPYHPLKFTPSQSQKKMKLSQPSKPTQKRSSKSKSKQKDDQTHLKQLRKLQAPKLQSKSFNKNKSQGKHSKSKASKEHKKQDAAHNEKMQGGNKNLFIQSRKKLTASQEQLHKGKYFKRKNQRNQLVYSNSKKDSKKSTDNENEETLVERLKAENQYYKKAFLAPKESLDKLEKYLQTQKQKRENEKQWFKYQINNLKRQLSADKIKFGHIYTFDSFQNHQVSNMIIQTQNQGSSLLIPCQNRYALEELVEGLSDLSIESK